MFEVKLYYIQYIFTTTQPLQVIILGYAPTAKSINEECAMGQGVKDQLVIG